MSTLAEIISLGEKLGFEGSELATFVKEQQSVEREERALERAAEKEKIVAEKEKLELELKIQLSKTKERSRRDSETSIHSNKSTDGKNANWGSWTSKLIPKFSEEEVGKFFLAFEKVASQLEWNKDIWQVLVQSIFVGKAQLAYYSLSDEDSLSYDKVKAAVLAAYQLVPEAYTVD